MPVEEHGLNKKWKWPGGPDTRATTRVTMMPTDTSGTGFTRTRKQRLDKSSDQLFDRKHAKCFPSNERQKLTSLFLTQPSYLMDTHSCNIEQHWLESTNLGTYGSKPDVRGYTRHNHHPLNVHTDRFPKTLLSTAVSSIVNSTVPGRDVFECNHSRRAMFHFSVPARHDEIPSPHCTLAYHHMSSTTRTQTWPQISSTTRTRYPPEHLKADGVNVLLYRTAHFNRDTPSNPLWQTWKNIHRRQRKTETWA
jgi:hypothetical protein